MRPAAEIYRRLTGISSDYTLPHTYQLGGGRNILSLATITTVIPVSEPDSCISPGTHIAA